MRAFLEWLKSIFSFLTPKEPATDAVAAFKAFVEKHLGVLYMWGGDYARWEAGKDYGLDCSGFEQGVAKFQGIDKPGDQTADGILDWYLQNGAKVIPFGEEKIGDRVFYEGSTVDGRWTHIAIVMGKNLIVGANGGDSNTTTPAKAKERGACIRYDKLDYRKDKHIIVRPAGMNLDGDVQDAPVAGQYKADWDHLSKGKEWTAITVEALKKHGKDMLALKSLGDASTWCPKWVLVKEPVRVKVTSPDSAD